MSKSYWTYFRFMNLLLYFWQIAEYNFDYQWPSIYPWNSQRHDWLKLISILICLETKTYGRTSPDDWTKQDDKIIIKLDFLNCVENVLLFITCFYPCNQKMSLTTQ